MTDGSRRRNLLLILLFNFTALLFIFIIAELGLRFFSDRQYQAPGKIRMESLQYEPSVFSIHVFPRREHLAKGLRGRQYYINQLGYRGLPFSPRKPEGVIRIIFYGGSQVFDSPATLGRDWPHQVEGLLRKAGFDRVETINAGIPGHASFDSVGRLLTEGHRFNPDYVVLCNAWNDIKYFRSDQPLLRDLHPYAAAQDPRVSYHGPVDRFMSERYQLYLRLRHLYYQWKENLGEEGRQPAGKLDDHLNPLGLDQYRLNIEIFADLARNTGAIPILMTQPRLVKPDNSPDQRNRIGYQWPLLTHEALVRAFAATDEIIRAVASEKGVPVINASAYLSGRDNMFIDHVHLTELGSRSLAGLAAWRISELLKVYQTGPPEGPSD